jgi:glycosyltransferase involved in cell wall biosynthesis
MVESIAGMQGPELSVIMCVYNGETFLKEAVESVLGQTYASFEFIVVNDGSTDRSAEILASFDDPRIKRIDNSSNLGLIRSLNIGLDLAKGDFIARMDADDICAPDRLQKQLSFLKDNPEIGLCGSWLKIVDEETSYKFPLTHDEIMAALLEYNAMAHPSVLLRTKLVKESGLRYDSRFPGAEDYELWSRMIFLTRFANIPETLLFYRRHEQQVTQNKKKLVEASSGKIKLGLLMRLNIEPTERESTVHLFLFNDQFKELKDGSILAEADEWMYKIVLANRLSGKFRERYLLELWKKKLLVTCIDRYQLKEWAILKRSRCFELAGVTTWERSKIFIKCLLGKKVGR